MKEKAAEEEEKKIINVEMSAEEKMVASSSEEDEMEAFICSDLKCRGYVALGFFGACLVLVIVKKSSSRTEIEAASPSSGEYQEVELGDDLSAEYGEDGSDDGIPSNMNIKIISSTAPN